MELFDITMPQSSVIQYERMLETLLRYSHKQYHESRRISNQKLKPNFTIEKKAALEVTLPGVHYTKISDNVIAIGDNTYTRQYDCSDNIKEIKSRQVLPSTFHQEVVPFKYDQLFIWASNLCYNFNMNTSKIQSIHKLPRAALKHFTVIDDNIFLCYDLRQNKYLFLEMNRFKLQVAMSFRRSLETRPLASERVKYSQFVILQDGGILSINEQYIGIDYIDEKESIIIPSLRYEFSLSPHFTLLNNDELVCYTPFEIHLYNLQARRCVKNIPFNYVEIADIQIIAKNIIAICGDNKISIIDLDKKDTLRELEVSGIKNGGPLNMIMATHRKFVSEYDKELILWEISKEDIEEGTHPFLRLLFNCQERSRLCDLVIKVYYY